MKTLLAPTLAWFTLLSFTTLATAQQKVENPEYSSWARFPKGTSIRLKTTEGEGQFKIEKTHQTTLLEVDADKVVLETAEVSMLGGSEMVGTGTKREVAKLALPPLRMSDDEFKKGYELARVGPGTKVDEQGSDLAIVPAGEFQCRKLKWSDFGVTSTDSLAWLSDAVPGMVVKTIVAKSRVVGSSFQRSTVTTVLVSIKKP